MAGDIPLQTKQEEKKEVLQPIDPSWNNTVTDENLNDAWVDYRRMIEQKNPRLASIMQNHKPHLTNGTVLFMKLQNATQVTELNAVKPVLFHFLKTKLHNANLSLEMEVAEVNKQVKKAFTAAERAKAMAEKNSSLLLLTKKFDLDVEL